MKTSAKWNLCSSIEKNAVPFRFTVNGGMRKTQWYSVLV